MTRPYRREMPSYDVGCCSPGHGLQHRPCWPVAAPLHRSPLALIAWHCGVNSLPPSLRFSRRVAIEDGFDLAILRRSILAPRDIRPDVMD